MHSRQPKFHRHTNLKLLTGVFIALASTSVAVAQATPESAPGAGSFQTFRLNSGSSLDDSTEVLTGLRVLLGPAAHPYFSPYQNAILLRGTPAELELAGKLIAELDHPQKDYRLTYTMTEMDGSKRVGVQHYVLVMFAGAHTTLKQGSKVPIATGSISNSGTATQFTFIDVGINLDATLDPAADGVRLRSKIEDSGLLEDKTIAGVSEPIIRQTVLQGTSLLQPGKPLVLGSLDVPGSTRHLDVEVLLTPMP